MTDSVTLHDRGCSISAPAPSSPAQPDGWPHRVALDAGLSGASLLHKRASATCPLEYPLVSKANGPRSPRVHPAETRKTGDDLVISDLDASLAEVSIGRR
jgi:hypothetical protein